MAFSSGIALWTLARRVAAKNPKIALECFCAGA